MKRRWLAGGAFGLLLAEAAHGAAFDYDGRVTNQSVGQSARVQLHLEQEGSRLSGQLKVFPPLTGSGPVVGVRTGDSCRLTSILENGSTLNFQGSCRADRFTGQYTLAGSGSSQQGRFDLKGPAADAGGPQAGTEPAKVEGWSYKGLSVNWHQWKNPSLNGCTLSMKPERYDAGLRGFEMILQRAQEQGSTIEQSEAYDVSQWALPLGTDLAGRRGLLRRGGHSASLLAVAVSDRKGGGWLWVLNCTDRDAQPLSQELFKGIAGHWLPIAMSEHSSQEPQASAPAVTTPSPQAATRSMERRPPASPATPAAPARAPAPAPAPAAPSQPYTAASGALPLVEVSAPSLSRDWSYSGVVDDAQHWIYAGHSGPVCIVTTRGPFRTSDGWFSAAYAEWLRTTSETKVTTSEAEPDDSGAVLGFQEQIESGAVLDGIALGFNNDNGTSRLWVLECPSEDFELGKQALNAAFREVVMRENPSARKSASRPVASRPSRPAAPPADSGRSAGGAVGGPPAKRYNCSVGYTFGSGGANGFTLDGAGGYQGPDGKRGTYSYDAGARRVHFESGPYKGVWVGLYGVTQKGEHVIWLHEPGYTGKPGAYTTTHLECM